MALTSRLSSSNSCLRTITASHPACRHVGRKIEQRSSHRHHATVADLPAELPLAGVRVLELGQLIAGPFAGQLLGHFGAEVIKVEPPHIGDPLRVWREIDLDGTSPWFRSIGRNKKSVTIDLRQEKGRKYDFSSLKRLTLSPL